METPGLAGSLSALGEDLLLLSIRPKDGRIVTLQRLRFGLMGSELVRLAAAGRIDIAENRIVVLDPVATGDAELDAALQSIAGARRPPRAQGWVSRPRRGIADAYLARLVSAGVLRAEVGGILSRTRWAIAAPARVADARARLDAIAQSAGQQIDFAQAAFGGLASAAGLDRVLYRGFGARQLRKRLTAVAAGKWTAPAAGAADTVAGTSAAEPTVMAPAAAVPPAATDAAVREAVQAAVRAAVRAAIAATNAAATAAAAAASG